MGIHAVTGSLYLVIMCLFSVITGSPLQDSSCGGVLKGKNGQFQSPRYPAPYPEAVTCKWTITGPENAEKIVITFSKFDIEWGPDCRFDFVRILDGGNEIAGNYKNCGSKDGLKVEVPGRIAYVVLVSDSTGTAQGFKAMFEAVSPKVVSKGDCDFDQGLCDDWSHDVNGNFQWTLGSGSTPSALTGPSSDHSGTGSYLFIESSPPRKEGDKARIVSTSLQAARCLTFYYFMYGLLGMGSLNVYIRSAGKDTPIWGLSGDQGRKWKKAQIPLPVDGSFSFQIVIEGTVGKSDYSDIAIDDITFSKEVCQPGGCGKRLNGMSGTFSTPDFPDKYPDDSRCTWTISGPPGTKKIIVKFLKFDLQLDGRCSKDYVRVFNKDGKQLGPNYCSFYPFGFGVKVDGNMAKIYFHADNFIRRRGFSATFETIQVESADDCDFDDGTTCSWTNSKFDDFDWTTRGGRTPSYFTGPSTDYLGLGKYAFIESSYRKQGDKARLVSKSMSGARCMLFMYNLRGIHMGKINVFQSYQDNRQPKSLFTISGNHERDWHKAMVDIPHDKDIYKIIIEGVVGSGFTSDAAIDEITFTSGSCPSQTCGGYLTANMGAISTPYYPRNYPNQAYCEWVINPFPYYKNLDITFEDFDVEKSPGCSKDYVRVLDAHKTQIGEKQCGLLKDMQQTTFKLQQQTTTRSHALYGYKAYVVFSSDSNGTRRGFKASYKVSQSRQICGGQLSGSSGNFSSPNYPNNYPTDEICEWEITASDVNKRLQISFKDFFIDDTVTCYYNYLMVYGGNKIERYCGNLSLRPIRIPSHVANIRFVTSQYYGPARGFLAEWRSVL